jgi:hypothetical protein
MSGELQKPSYGATCNGCGLCCKLEICGVGEMALADLGVYDGPEAWPPCIFLVELDGLYRCKLVLVEADNLYKLPGAEPRIANSLRIGWGCTMPDEEGVAA